MRPDIERIWKLCFPEDNPEVVRYFFDHRYNPNACIVYIDSISGRPVAMLHIMDIMITDDSEIKNAQYLYAAGTRPDFRGQGIMTKMLAAAQKYAQAKHKAYSVVLPAEHSLIKFYEKNGFYRCFQSRFMTFTRNDLSSLAKYAGAEGKTMSVILGDRELAEVRRDSLIDREGYVTWGDRAVSYAMGAHEAEGGRVIAVQKNHAAAYAFCIERKNKMIEITEIISPDDLCIYLCRAILDAYPNGSVFSLRVPVCNEFFAPYGDVSDFGMIKTTSGRRATNLLTLTGKHAPYLGLVLD